MTDNDDNNSIVDADNIFEEPKIDMKEIFLHIDKNMECLDDNGGLSVNAEESMEDEEIKMLTLTY